MQNLLITNCRPLESLSNGQAVSILIENGKIARIGSIDPAACNCETLDAENRIVAPGLIDVHIQGAGGADVLDATPEALQAISKTCARFGVTGFLATTVYKPQADNRHLQVAAENVGRDLGGAHLLGIHLEGPFISARKRGMIQPECLCPPGPEVLDSIFELTRGHLKMMTIAPELPGALDAVSSLVESGVIASFGHSSATYDQTLRGFDAGIDHVTHLFNAMPSIHHRDPGPLVAILQAEQVTAQLITDGVHIHPAVLKLAFERLGPSRSIPITDGMQAIGLPDGKYLYNGIEYESRNGAARYEDGTLIGTALGLNNMLARLVEFTHCSPQAALRMAAANPAALLAMEDSKAAVETGMDADLIVVDDDLNVQATIVSGKVVFRK